MPSVSLCPTAGCFYQAFTDGGLPLNAGLIYTYIAGGTTPQATYTTTAGSVANANPIVLDADGRTPSEVWLINGQSYRFDLKDSDGNLLKTYDNVGGIITSDTLAGSGGAALVGFIQAGSGAVATTLQTKGRQVVSAFDYMTAAQIADVIANTAAEDVTSAIQAAATYSSVYFPAGTYKVTSAISVPGSRLLKGQGKQSIIAFSGSMAANSVFTSSSVAGVRFEDLRITGTQSNDAGSDPYGAAIYMATCTDIVIQNVECATFPQSGIILRGCSRFTVTGCNVQSIVPPTASTDGVGGITVIGACEDGSVTNNFVKTVGKSDGTSGVGIRIAIDGSVPSKIRTIGNHVEDTAIHGLMFYNSSGVVDAGGSVIANNIVKRTGLSTDAAVDRGNGIYCTGVGGLQITGNSVYSANTNTPAGTIVEGAIVVSNSVATPSTDMTVISGNVIDTSLIDGISVQAARVSITGNSLKAITGRGIKVLGDTSTRSTGCTISGNTINATTTSGIYVESFDDVAVTGNSLYGIGTNGVSLNNVSRFTISGNTGYGDGGATDYGIAVQEDLGANADGAITGNNMQNFGNGLLLATLVDCTVTGNTFGYSASGSSFSSLTNVDVAYNVFAGANTLKVVSTDTAAATSSFRFNRAIDRNTYSTPYIDSPTAGLQVVTYGGAVPNQGAWQVGDTVWQRTPVSAQAPGWMCTVAGSPGTWVAMAVLA